MSSNCNAKDICLSLGVILPLHLIPGINKRFLFKSSQEAQLLVTSYLNPFPGGVSVPVNSDDQDLLPLLSTEAEQGEMDRQFIHVHVTRCAT